MCLSLFLTGCTNDGFSTKMEALSLDEVQSKRAAQSLDERDGMIYQYVTDRLTVGTEDLMGISADNLTSINNILSEIAQELAGTKPLYYLDSHYANYLLLEFARTPYMWYQLKSDPIGYDPASKLFFVDVTYTTSGATKHVVGDSSLAKGDVYYDLYAGARLEDWNAYLELCLRNGQNHPDSTKAFGKFVEQWGDPYAIMAEQQGTPLTERTRALGASMLDENGTVSSYGIGRLTYTGLLGNTFLSNQPATMTIRYIFKHRYNLGEETDLAIHALYLKNFEIAPSEGYDAYMSQFKLGDKVGVEVLNPFIDRLLISYNKAVEEGNHIGLNSLFVKYNSMDKYYEDLAAYTYRFHEGYSHEIIEKTGTSLLVKVNRVRKLRAYGANMSMPTYDEVVIFDLELTNEDMIKIKGVYPVSIKLSGEPLSVIKNVSSVSDSIQYDSEAFTESNKEKVLETLKKFNQVVIDRNTQGDAFIECVDLGVSQSIIQKIMERINAINAEEMACYIVSWDTQTNSYCSLTIREVFKTKGGTYDTESVIDIANDNGVWKVVNYNRLLNIKVDKPATTGEDDGRINTVKASGNASAE